MLGLPKPVVAFPYIWSLHVEGLSFYRVTLHVEGFSSIGSPYTWKAFPSIRNSLHVEGLSFHSVSLHVEGLPFYYVSLHPVFI
jgi:hypothetical protein